MYTPATPLATLVNHQVRLAARPQGLGPSRAEVGSDGLLECLIGLFASQAGVA
jgi:hypothetical protein